MEKRCFKCGAIKPLDEFYKHSQMRDGHFNKCKECAKNDVTSHRDENIEKVRLYDNQRSKLTHRKQYARKHTIDYRKHNPEKYHAHSLVNNAVRDGRLIKPTECEICGEQYQVLHAHHKDYNKPLEVEWLCPVCHSLTHHPRIAREAMEHYSVG